MINIYYSNKLDAQLAILVELLKLNSDNDTNIFTPTIVLTQSAGMSKWVKMQIAESIGIAANIDCKLPAEFFWQQYKQNLHYSVEKTLFSKDNLIWFLMQEIPNLIENPTFISLKQYLADDLSQLRLFQLSEKIADLYDQYLLYRPDWLHAWEQGNINQNIINTKNLSQARNIEHDILWQAQLWYAICKLISKVDITQKNRSTLHKEYLATAKQGAIKKYPKDIYIFGITSLPIIFIKELEALSIYTNIHLFFTNPAKYYWADLPSQNFLNKLKLKQLANPKPNQKSREAIDLAYCADHPLLSNFGELGKNFLYLLTQLETNDREYYIDIQKSNLLQYMQQQILNLNPPLNTKDDEILANLATDPSLTIHSCYSIMREIEVLHDQLLQLFTENSGLTPKDILVMVPDIEQYTPYIKAVFSNYSTKDPRYIPFSITDINVATNDLIISNFLSLLTLNQIDITPEKIFALLSVNEICIKFNLSAEDVALLKNWILKVNIRSNLQTQTTTKFSNYNTWLHGLERLLLGGLMRDEDGIWENSIGFDANAGLNTRIIGDLCEFISQLNSWLEFLQTSHSIETWQLKLQEVLSTFFYDNRNNHNSNNSLIFLQQQIDLMCNQIRDTAYKEKIDANIISLVFKEKLNNSNTNNANFLRGKVNICSLLPMRSIPFKVICLLGMNDLDYPRQQVFNSFDLMQYSQQKGDRNKRTDDKYLFLEALISAQEKLYISYIGRSIIDNTILEPSVLVNQLIEYIAQYLGCDTVTIKRHLVFEHPMSAFSANNYQSPNFSYAQEWVQIDATQIMPNFADPIANSITKQHYKVNITDLLLFINDPIKHYFNKNLNIYFDKLTETLPEKEKFQLSGLDSYQLQETLFLLATTKKEKIKDHLQIAGQLPLSKFADITFTQAFQHHDKLKQKIQGYLTQEKSSKTITMLFDLENNSVVELYGEIDNLYISVEGQQHYVTWRYGNIREQDILNNWLIFLLLNYNNAYSINATIYDKEGQTQDLSFKNFLTFSNLNDFDKNEFIKNQLTNYLETYIQGLSQIQIIPSMLWQNWLKISTDLNVTTDIIQARLLHLLTNYQDHYWFRLLEQTNDLNIELIDQKMKMLFQPIAQFINFSK